MSFWSCEVPVIGSISHYLLEFEDILWVLGSGEAQAALVGFAVGFCREDCLTLATDTANVALTAGGTGKVRSGYDFAKVAQPLAVLGKSHRGRIRRPFIRTQLGEDLLSYTGWQLKIVESCTMNGWITHVHQTYEDITVKTCSQISVSSFSKVRFLCLVIF